ncbi:hypothetical protein ALC53_05819 [Acetobacter orientalis]|uniref:Uncharacterized protein n=1 Tax=Acetobacter orientalis TaxID=146474 RepID=A0A2Z5ZG66_9PROT|nr:hypothetical protein ALC53_05819 [Acetobacter orientalis]
MHTRKCLPVQGRARFKHVLHGYNWPTCTPSCIETQHKTKATGQT